MKRTLLLVPVLALALTACGDGTNDNASIGTDDPTPTPTATATATQGPASAGPCKASEGGSKDTTKKPVYDVPKDAKDPATTTVTDIVCGTGKEAVAGSAVTVQYVGVNFKTGEEFDTSWGKTPFEFTVGSGVIQGFTTGVTGMKEGGRRLVVIPPQEGYGDQGPVPGGSLAFLIDLVKIG